MRGVSSTALPMGHSLRSSEIVRAALGLAVVMGQLWIAAAGWAQTVSPILSYSPTTAAGTGSDCAASGLSTLQTNPSSVLDVSVSNSVSVNANGLTVFSCTLEDSQGANFTFAPGEPHIFNTDNNRGNLAPVSFQVGCTAGDRDKTGVLRCTESRLSPTFKNLYCYNLNCAAAGIPDIDTTPAAGSTLALSANVGTTATTTVQLRNVGSGSAALTYQTSPLSGSMSVTPITQQSVSAGASSSIVVSCTPTQIGTQSATLVVSSNDADESSISFPVTCLGKAPLLQLTPPPGSLSISSTQPSDATQTLVVSNNGNAPLDFSVVGLGSPFIAGSSAGTVPVGGSANVVITCPGSTAGTFVDGQFAINTNDPSHQSNVYDITCQVSATPTGTYRSVPPPPGPLAIATSPGVAASASIVVSNDGNASLQLGPIGGLTPPLSAPPGPITIPAGGSSTVTVSCQSASTGNFSQTLSIAVAGQSARTYDVVCKVSSTTAPEFNSVPAPGTLSLATSQGVAASRIIELQNVGTADLLVSLTTAPTTPFSASPSSPFPMTIAPGTSKTVTVTCNSASAGSFSGQLTLGTNDSDEPAASYPLACAVASSAPEFVSTPAAPGPLQLTALRGSNASTVLNVSNSGTSALLVSSISGLVAPLSVSPGTATIAPGQSQNFTITCSGANAGTFTNNLVVANNDADEGSVGFQVICRITTLPPEFDSTPVAGTALVLSALIGQSSTSTLTVRNLAPSNPSDLNLSYSGMSAPLSTSKSSSVVGAGGSDSLIVTCTPTRAETINQTLVMVTNDSDENPVSFPVSCSGFQQAGAQFAANYADGDSIFLGTVKGGTSQVIYRVYNRGFGQDLTVNYSMSSSGTNSVTISRSSAVIPPGSYADARIVCTADNAGFTRGNLSVTSSTGFHFYGVFCNNIEIPVTTTAKRVAIIQALRGRPDLLFTNGLE